MNNKIRKTYPHKKIWPMFIALAMMICLFTTTTYGGNKKMEQQPLYDFKETMTIAPQTYKINQSTPLSIFPVPFDNAIGTNDLNNAITIFSFPEGKLRDDRYFRNVVDDIEGSGKYLPVISKNEIGFALGRVFLLFNFKTKTHKVYRTAMSLGRTIEKMAIADADRKRFIVEVESMSNKSEDWRDSKNYLQLIDLSSKELKLVKETLRPTGTLWSVVNETVFLWDYSEKKLQVLDMNFEPATHPLGDLIKQKKDKLNFGLIHAHPQLPFAILSDTVISWGEGRDKNPQLLVTRSQQFSFSPDGKWVAFRQGGVTSINKTYLMPVSEKYPNYLGKPILLIDRPFSPGKFAWTTNPIGFVGSGAKDLYRWELTKETQKENMGDGADKYPTFHDYIVAKDLEKLTKEKKQGLGKK